MGLEDERSRVKSDVQSDQESGDSDRVLQSLHNDLELANGSKISFRLDHVNWLSGFYNPAYPQSRRRKEQNSALLGFLIQHDG